MKYKYAFLIYLLGCTFTSGIWGLKIFGLIPPFIIATVFAGIFSFILFILWMLIEDE
jgi:hypothetical protein